MVGAVYNVFPAPATMSMKSFDDQRGPYMSVSKLPAQPPERAWTFVDELRSPLWTRHAWPARDAARNESDLRRGVRLLPGFPDSRGLLRTAYADLGQFLAAGGIRQDGPFGIETAFAETPCFEAFRMEVTPAACRILAADTEGIRRGIIFLEDEMLRRGGPFLPRGTVIRKPAIRTRLSRCFYGPINRPPKSKDELVDDVDYYPDEYLNRLAHDGVNALWMTIHFFQTVPSKIIPQYGRNAAPRLEKLRRIVGKCARYGIRIYPFCIEPAALTLPHPELAAAAAAHPDLLGHAGAFCTSTDKGRAYLEEATRTLFTEVPGLGGLVVIPVGERRTHCYSMPLDRNTCPRCSKRAPWDVLSEALATLARGMHSVDPTAELVAWPYSQRICWGERNTVKAAGCMPREIILQHNYETAGWNRQLGRRRRAWDYWLSYVGPSDIFRRCARAAVSHGVRISAKLQVGCSHEVATTQVVPAPGLLFRKYREMRRLGVSAAMHSWYFGSYPSVMTRAAGELSFSPFPVARHAFLLSLAQREWGGHARQVARAWEWFERGYSQYPTAHVFGYFGPMHDGPVWPLHLVPRRLPLAPTWQIGYPPSGDHIAQCVTNGFTLREMLVLCKRMAERWDQGVRILKRLRRHYLRQPERLKDIGVAVALGLQFRSGYNILRFYSLREQLAEAPQPAKRQRLLRGMADIVREEMAVSRALVPLAESDSRLGFHSEAEGYKYYPALLEWRIRQLRQLLRQEFPAVARQAALPAPLFPEYTGESPAGPVYACQQVRHAAMGDQRASARAWAEAPRAECAQWLRSAFDQARWLKCAYDSQAHHPVSEEDRQGRATAWRALWDPHHLHIAVVCSRGAIGDFRDNRLRIALEACRTEPMICLDFTPDGEAQCGPEGQMMSLSPSSWKGASRINGTDWLVTARIAWRALGDAAPRRAPLRINVFRSMPCEGRLSVMRCSWAPLHPAQGRLVWGVVNPATDFGWLRFDGHGGRGPSSGSVRQTRRP